MNKFKLADVAKRANMEVGDAIRALKEAGVNVEHEHSDIDESDVKVLGVDAKLLLVDKRQEMLKKAMERHQKHPKSREVLVKETAAEIVSDKKKLMKEELMKKKHALEENIKKVDELREKGKSDKSSGEHTVENTISEELHVSQAVATEETFVHKEIEHVNKNIDKIETNKIEPVKEILKEAVLVEADKSIDTTTAPVVETKNDNNVEIQRVVEKKPEHSHNSRHSGHDHRDRTHGDRPQGDRPYNRDNRDRPQGDRPQGDRPYNRDNRDRPQGDRPQGDRPYNRDNRDRPQGDRPQGDRPYNRDNRDRPQGDRPQGDRPYNRDNRDRPQGDRPHGDRPYNRDNRDRPQGDRPYNRDNRERPAGDRPQGDRPYNRDNRDRPQGDRPYNRDNRERPAGDRPYNRDNRDNRDSRPQSGGSRTGDPKLKDLNTSILPETLIEEKDLASRRKKKGIEEKPEEVEAKKVKAKKGDKKEKNIIKDILEGIDELDIEKEIVPNGGAVEAVVEIPVVVEKVQEQVVDNSVKPKERERKGRYYKEEVVEQKPKIPAKPTRIEVGENVSINDLARLMGIKTTEIIKKLMTMGIMVTANQSVDSETAQLLGAEFSVEVIVKTITEDDLMPVYVDQEEDLSWRPPIVTVMGHVDHGKTSLLDAVRKTRVAEKEAGGITQHIGAYEVELEKGKIVFLDTPGHEAFTTLRARGANVTDIVILVVAADDGVMPQTKEAIDHAKAAGVRIVVAVNKIDKPNANPEKVKTQLADYGIISEEWGGEYQFQEVSAKSRINIEDLLERVLLEAEILELKGNPNRPADGVVIESRLDKQKGSVATVLVKNGTLKNGDYFIVGHQYGKVKAMFNYIGKVVKEAGPSIPVELMGFGELPESGEKFLVVPTEKLAKQISEMRTLKRKEKELLEKSHISLTDIFAKIKEGEIQDLNIILKADVQGSLEALKSSLLKLSNAEVNVKIIHDGVGGINESDVLLASASNAIIIGFNVRPESNAKNIADREKVDINLYSIIYEAIEDVQNAVEGMLSPEIKENIIGKVEIRKVYSVPKIGKVAGCYVLEGKVNRNSNIRLIRDNIVVYSGKIDSLRRFQDDVKEVVAGYECGLNIAKYNDIRESDILEIFEMVSEKRSLKDVEQKGA